MHKIDPLSSLTTMDRIGPLLAKARAERVYCEEYRKSLKALLMADSAGTTAVAQERDAYGSQRYRDHLAALKAAVEQEEMLRWQMVTAQAAIDVWRSQEASNRNQDRSMR